MGGVGQRGARREARRRGQEAGLPRVKLEAVDAGAGLQTVQAVREPGDGGGVCHVEGDDGGRVPPPEKAALQKPGGASGARLHKEAALLALSVGDRSFLDERHDPDSDFEPQGG